MAYSSATTAVNRRSFSKALFTSCFVPKHYAIKMSKSDAKIVGRVLLFLLIFEGNVLHFQSLTLCFSAAASVSQSVKTFRFRFCADGGPWAGEDRYRTEQLGKQNKEFLFNLSILCLVRFLCKNYIVLQWSWTDDGRSTRSCL